MIVHHAATIMLIYFSWATNFIRIGCIVLIAHDAADFPMAVSQRYTVIFMPPFEEVGVYCFAHVGRSVRQSVDL